MKPKTAIIAATPAASLFGFLWSWRCEADGASSSGSFALYYECVMDAQRRGYRVELTQAVGDTAPGGAGYAITSR